MNTKHTAELLSELLDAQSFIDAQIGVQRVEIQDKIRAAIALVTEANPNAGVVQPFPKGRWS